MAFRRGVVVRRPVAAAAVISSVARERERQRHRTPEKRVVVITDYEAAYRLAFVEPYRSETRLSLEVISGAAAYWAVGEWEKRQRAEGRDPRQNFTRDALDLLALVAVDRLIETKRLDYIDIQLVRLQAKVEAQNLFSRRYGLPPTPVEQTPVPYGQSSNYGQGGSGYGQQQYAGGNAGYSQIAPQQQQQYPAVQQTMTPQQPASSSQSQFPGPPQAVGSQLLQQQTSEHPSSQTYPPPFQPNIGPPNAGTRF